MPADSTPEFPRHHVGAVEQVQNWLLGLDKNVRHLVPGELYQYKDRAPVAGWRLPLSFLTGIEKIDLLLDAQFPRTQPRIFFAGGRGKRVYPHLEHDGALCIYPNSSSFTSRNPLGVVQNALGSACELIEKSLAKENTEDFRNEFHSYWELYADLSALPVWSLLEPGSPTREITVWYGTDMLLVGENDTVVTQWLTNRYSAKQWTNFPQQKALLLWLEQAFLPEKYPRYASDVLKIAKDTNPATHQLLLDTVSDTPEHLLIIFGFQTSLGACFAAAIITPPSKPAPHQRILNPLTKGFRSEHIPSKFLARNYFSKSSLRCSKVDRIDPVWVHGRGEDSRSSILRGKTVTILGCGSVGAPVAIALAQAGVGTLYLVDPDILVHANLGRHPLGAGALKKRKALALKEMIQGNLPHIVKIESYPKCWEKLGSASTKVLDESNLIVSAIGDWSAEGALNEWHVCHGRSVPIVYGWTEAHACAGHAIAIQSKGGCLQCGLSEWGESSSQVITWPELQLRREPTCGASFQPYGPVELGFITALVAELALDCLHNMISESTQRTWIARCSVIEKLGGELTEFWQKRTTEQHRGGFVDELKWPRDVSCIECSDATK